MLLLLLASYVLFVFKKKNKNIDEIKVFVFESVHIISIFSSIARIMNRFNGSGSFTQISTRSFYNVRFPCYKIWC